MPVLGLHNQYIYRGLIEKPLVVIISYDRLELLSLRSVYFQISTGALNKLYIRRSTLKKFTSKSFKRTVRLILSWIKVLLLFLYFHQYGQRVARTSANMRDGFDSHD